MKKYTDTLPRKGTPERELREEQWQQFPDTAPNKANPTPGEAQHSPLPWRVTPPKATLSSWTIASDCDIAQVLWTGSNERAYANAKLIVASVNHADRLAEALRELIDAARRNGFESELANQTLKAWENAK